MPPLFRNRNAQALTVLDLSLVGNTVETHDFGFPHTILLGDLVERITRVENIFLNHVNGFNRRHFRLCVYAGHRCGSQVSSRRGGLDRIGFRRDLLCSRYLLRVGRNFSAGRNIERVTGFDVITPLFSRENAYIPNANRVLRAARKVLKN